MLFYAHHVTVGPELVLNVVLDILLLLIWSGLVLFLAAVLVFVHVQDP